MIAARRRRIGPALALAPRALRRWSLRADRAGNRMLERAHPVVLRVRQQTRRGWLWLWPRLRPVLAFIFRALASGERDLRRAGAASARAATAASAVVTPRRAAAAAMVACGLLLVASQFIDYRAVEIGQPGYADLPQVARAPTVAAKTAGEAHSYLLVPLGAIAAALGAFALRGDRRRYGLAAAAIGLFSVALILVVDRPAGLDAGAQAARFSGASAVLEDGFYAELAAAGGMVLAGLLYYARPCRTRTNLSGRAASARRRRPRRRASSRAKVARSA
ncbi:MAG TPA: hypothetical protein VFI17_04825 [Solirubrobacterales bacterium]|nr:hypothetical protein [Solirubrobacterales bacterium]